MNVALTRNVVALLQCDAPCGLNVQLSADWV